MRSQGAHMVGDKVLSALDDPSEVTDAELIHLEQRRGKRQPCRIGKRMGPARGGLRFMHPESPSSQPLRGRQVEAEKIAAIIGHIIILTLIGALLPCRLARVDVSRLLLRAGWRDEQTCGHPCETWRGAGLPGIMANRRPIKARSVTAPTYGLWQSGP